MWNNWQSGWSCVAEHGGQDVAVMTAATSRRYPPTPRLMCTCARENVLYGQTDCHRHRQRPRAVSPNTCAMHRWHKPELIIDVRPWACLPWERRNRGDRDEIPTKNPTTDAQSGVVRRIVIGSQNHGSNGTRRDWWWQMEAVVRVGLMSSMYVLIAMVSRWQWRYAVVAWLLSRVAGITRQMLLSN